MTAHAVLAEKTVTLSALQNDPAQYFSDQPVAVMSHNKPIGYVVGAELFECMMEALETQAESLRVEACFRPTVAQLKAIRTRGAEAILKATPEQMEDYRE